MLKKYANYFNILKSNIFSIYFISFFCSFLYFMSIHNNNNYLFNGSNYIHYILIGQIIISKHLFFNDDLKLILSLPTNRLYGFNSLWLFILPSTIVFILPFTFFGFINNHFDFNIAFAIFYCNLTFLILALSFFPYYSSNKINYIYGIFIIFNIATSLGVLFLLMNNILSIFQISIFILILLFTLYKLSMSKFLRKDLL